MNLKAFFSAVFAWIAYNQLQVFSRFIMILTCILLNVAPVITNRTQQFVCYAVAMFFGFGSLVVVIQHKNPKTANFPMSKLIFLKLIVGCFIYLWYYLNNININDNRDFENFRGYVLLPLICFLIGGVLIYSLIRTVIRSFEERRIILKYIFAFTCGIVFAVLLILYAPYQYFKETIREPKFTRTYLMIEYNRLQYGSEVASIAFFMLSTWVYSLRKKREAILNFSFSFLPKLKNEPQRCANSVEHPVAPPTQPPMSACGGIRSPYYLERLPAHNDCNSQNV